MQQSHCRWLLFALRYTNWIALSISKTINSCRVNTHRNHHDTNSNWHIQSVGCDIAKFIYRLISLWRRRCSENSIKIFAIRVSFVLCISCFVSYIKRLAPCGRSLSLAGKLSVVSQIKCQNLFAQFNFVRYANARWRVPQAICERVHNNIKINDTDTSDSLQLKF